MTSVSLPPQNSELWSQSYTFSKLILYVDLKQILVRQRNSFTRSATFVLLSILWAAILIWTHFLNSELRNYRVQCSIKASNKMPKDYAVLTGQLQNMVMVKHKRNMLLVRGNIICTFVRPNFFCMSPDHIDWWRKHNGIILFKHKSTFRGLSFYNLTRYHTQFSPDFIGIVLYDMTSNNLKRPLKSHKKRAEW